MQTDLLLCNHRSYKTVGGRSSVSCTATGERTIVKHTQRTCTCILHMHPLQEVEAEEGVGAKYIGTLKLPFTNVCIHVYAQGFV